MIAEVIGFALLFVPYIWEVYSDRNGDHDKTVDVIWRVILSATAVLSCVHLTDHSIWAAGLMCSAIFFLLFDYTVAAVLIKNGVIEAKSWFSYMGKSGKFDNWGWWRNMHPGWRFAIKMSVFTGSLLIYINE